MVLAKWYSSTSRACESVTGALSIFKEYLYFGLRKPSTFLLLHLSLDEDNHTDGPHVTTVLHDVSQCTTMLPSQTKAVEKLAAEVDNATSIAISQSLCTDIPIAFELLRYITYTPENSRPATPDRSTMIRKQKQKESSQVALYP